MAILTPDNVKTINGVTVKDYSVIAHNPHKIDMPQLMAGAPLGVTIHNTDAINVKGTTMSEQYTRATVNGNMGSVRVHFYADGVEAWQNLPLNFQSWHAGQRGKADKNGSEMGNARTISIECIMRGSTDEKAEDNAARLAAYCLSKYGLTIDSLYTHNYWCNVRNGKKGDVDFLNGVDDGYKGCPIYIRPHWGTFKAAVKKYLDALNADNLAEQKAPQMYYVQVGAFKNTVNANAYLSDVRKKCRGAFIKYDGEYYRVQLGAFAKRENAENYLQTVKKDYPAAFIKAV